MKLQMRNNRPGKAKVGKIKKQRTNIANFQAISAFGSSGPMITDFDRILQASNPNPKHCGIYSNRHEILLIGEGNFTFARALALFLGGDKLFATSFDSQHDFHNKYRNSRATLKELSTLNAKVHFNVDATNLESQPWLMEDGKIKKQFNRIVFNFPHTGGGDEFEKSTGMTVSRPTGPTQEEVIQANKKMLYDFFESAAPFLTESPIGEVHVALRTGGFYKRWAIEEQARKAGLALKSKDAFDASAYPGYENARTASADLFRGAPTTENALVYVFVASPHLMQKKKERLALEMKQSIKIEKDRDSAAEKTNEKEKETSGKKVAGGNEKKKAPAPARQEVQKNKKRKREEEKKEESDYDEEDDEEEEEEEVKVVQEKGKGDRQIKRRKVDGEQRGRGGRGGGRGGGGRGSDRGRSGSGGGGGGGVKRDKHRWRDDPRGVKRGGGRGRGGRGGDRGRGGGGRGGRGGKRGRR